MRNDLTLYDEVANQWWSDEVRWVRTLKNLVPGRLSWFDGQFDWAGKDVLDLGCAGGFMAEALADRGARVTGIDPAEKAIAIARSHARATNRDIAYDTGVGEALPYPDAGFDAVVCVDVLEHVSDSTGFWPKWPASCAPAACSCSTPSTAIRWRGLLRSPLPRIS